MTYYLDMDGTIADLYGVENWLEDLINEKTTPYKNAKPLLNMSQLAKALHKVQNKGEKIGIISWTSKNGSNEYNKKVAAEKMKWLSRHLPSVKWDYIKIVDYGTPKQNLANKNDILFDDEIPNRIAWGQKAYEPSQILKILAA